MKVSGLLAGIMIGAYMVDEVKGAGRVVYVSWPSSSESASSIGQGFRVSCHV